MVLEWLNLGNAGVSKAVLGKALSQMYTHSYKKVSCWQKNEKGDEAPD